MGKEDKNEEVEEQETEEVEEQEEEQGDDIEETDDFTEEEVNENQVERLRKERDEATEEAEEYKEKLSKRIDELENNITQNQRNELLDQYAGDDEDTRKAMMEEFKNYRPGDNSPEAVEERMKKAARIVGSSQDSPSVLDNGTTSAGGGINKDAGGGESEGISEGVKEIGDKLGISEDDYKEHANEE